MSTNKFEEEEDLTRMPDYIECMPDDVKAAWTEWVELGRQIDNHPQRYYPYVGADGEERVADLKGCAVPGI